MAKYFGTDGIRGIYNDSLDEDLAFRTGHALAKYFGEGKYIIVRDTRSSGIALMDALLKGIYVGGGSVLVGGVLPTPAAAVLVKKHNAQAGIVISASHNPPEYNGIKVFDGKGAKIDPEAEEEIERLMDFVDLASTPSGKYHVLSDAQEYYITTLLDEVPIDLSGLNVVLDCGFGAAGGNTAKEVFSRLGASVTVYNDSLDGTQINKNCGATHIDFLQGKLFGSPKNSIGFAFDGDADRLAVVIHDKVLDGDTVLYNLVRAINAQGGVVGTILSNLALEERLKAEGLVFCRTDVGDKHIAKKLFESGFSVGGEQSGHYIINHEYLTGDAIRAALYLLKALYKDKKLCEPFALSLYPQSQASFFADKNILHDEAFLQLLSSSKDSLAGEGRVVARMSGTEPKVRIMAEGKCPQKIKKIMDDFAHFFGGDE